MKQLSKKAIKETVDKLDNEISEFKKDIETSYEEADGKAIIHLDLTKASIYKEYSNNTMLSDDLYSFIEESFLFVRKNAFITLSIHYPENMDEAEKRKIENLIRIHYAIRIKEEQRLVKNTNILSLIMLVVGAIIYGIFCILALTNNNQVVNGIIEIASWVFIWEAVNEYFFQNSVNKRNLVRSLRLYHSVLNEKE